MKASPRSPAEIFGYDLRFVVPIFQRPYVWNETDQWGPLWDDVRVLAERVMETPAQLFGGGSVPPHFLGAIVVEQQLGTVGYVSVWHVVDGQQRLTTLQLLLDAAQEVTEKHGVPKDASALRALVLNDPAITQQPDEVYKVWPTNRDQAAFRAAMDNAAVVPSELAASRIALAHAFFVRKIAEWAGVTGDPDRARSRLNAIARALRDHLRVVVIDLEPGDNAQVIFESLNHRGTRLLAADLVKNRIFQIAQAQRLDVQSLYDDHWKPLDGDHWRELIAQGRLYRPRIDVFLNYWLTMKLQREVLTDRIYDVFRHYVEEHNPSVAGLITEIARDARVFAELENLPAASVEGRFHYRVVRALDTGAVTPVLLWLWRWPASELPTDQRHRALLAIESWLVRRALARLTGKGINQVVVELLQALYAAGPAAAGDRTESFLAEQTADARLWPDDDAVRDTLAREPVYKALLRPRLRMILEALEDDLRTAAHGEGQPCPRGLSVEHVMPQHWEQHWPLEADADEADAVRRNRQVHRIGNLTLVSGRLNPALSNRPWTADGSGGKRDYLLSHSQLKLNAALVAKHPDAWTESDIDTRTAAITGRLLAMWPRPATARASTITDSAREAGAVPVHDRVDDDQPGHTGKYQALWRWLREQHRDDVDVSFADVEQVLDMALPPSARSDLPPWYGYQGTALGRAIRDAGWKATNVSLTEERVTFVRQEEPDDRRS